MKWVIGVLVICAIISCIKIMFRKIAGVALLLGLGFSMIGWITDIPIFFTLARFCVCAVIIVVIGSVIHAIFED